MFLSKCFSSIEPLKYFSHVLFHFGQIHNHTWSYLRFTLLFKLGFGSKMFSRATQSRSDKKDRRERASRKNTNQIFENRANVIKRRLCRIASMLPVLFCSTCLIKIVKVSQYRLFRFHSNPVSFRRSRLEFLGVTGLEP